MPNKFKVRSFNVSWECVADSQAYNGFNVALCVAGDNPVTNPVKVLYVKPAFNLLHLYNYTFKHQLVAVGNYDVWVQAVSFGKDSFWRSAGGLEIPDDGVGTIGGGPGEVDPDEIKDIVQDGLDNDQINIDGDKTTIINIDGGKSIVVGTITAELIKAGQIIAEHIAAGTIVANHIAANTIVANHIKAGEIVANHIAANQIVAHHIAVNQIVAGHIAAEQIVAGHIAAGQILATHIAAGAITAQEINVHDLVVSGLAMITEAYIGGVHLLNNTVTADKVVVNTELTAKLATIQEAWIGGVHLLNNTVTADKVVVNGELTAKLATVEEAWIGGVHISENAVTAQHVSSDTIQARHITTSSINASHVSAGAIGTQHLSANSIESQHIKSDQIISRVVAADAIEAKHVKIDASLSAKLATIQEAYIGGVHIVNNSIKAEKIDSYDLATNGLADLNVAYVTEAHIGQAQIKSAHIADLAVKAAHIEKGTLTMAEISNILQSTNYSANTTGWQIRKDGTAEFCGGVKVGNWIVAPNKLQSKSTGARIELVADKNRVSILGSTGVTELAMGYWGGLQKFDEDGNLLSGQFHTDDERGYYILPGNKLSVRGDAEYSGGSWSVKSGGSYRILNALNDTIVKMGTEAGEVGTFIYDNFGNITSALTNSRIEIGNIATGTGLKYDSEGLNIVGRIKLTAPTDTSGITVPEPYNVGYQLL